jgi:peptidyl-prolyl cis-trans isomerase SurA
MKQLLLRWLAVVGTGVALAAEPRLLNSLVVIVDQEIITLKDVLQYIAPAVEVITRTYAGQPEVLRQKLQEAERDGIEQLVERKLILHEFERAGYNLPESLIEDRVKERLRERFGGDRAAMTRTLQSQGMTYEAFRRRLREDIIIGAMRARNIGSDKIIVSPYKIEKYYAENLDKFRIKDQLKLRAIMLNAGTTRSREAARRLAAEILAKLREGAPFDEMARVYSEDTYRAQGGDRGWIERGDLRKELAEAAFNLKPGQPSEVIEVGDTFWILLVEDARANQIRTLPEVRDEIVQTLQAEEQARLNREWIQRLKAKSFVRYFSS